MKKIPSSILDRLDLEAAALSEATCWRNLLPEEPWLDSALRATQDVAKWVRVRLESGAFNASGSIVNARKGIQGTRPVPILGIAERIAYRALTDLALEQLPAIARTSSDYFQFVTGPIRFAFAGSVEPHRESDASVSYVVEADISAFYQYIDHEILRHELEMQTGEVAVVECLIELLDELQGASFGLPQLIDASDRLSECYAAILERDLIRRGLHVWRYNDDFRIGVETFEAAQDALEVLSDSARALGLVLNDQKSYTSKFWNYVIRHVGTGDRESAGGDGLDIVEFLDSDIEALFDYDDSEDSKQASVDRAKTILGRLDRQAGDPNRLDLKALNLDGLRNLRFAINSFKRAGDAAGLDRVVSLCLFAPTLTPRLCEYLVEMHATEADRVAEIWNSLALESATSLSEWQIVWLIHVARKIGLLNSLDERSSGFLLRQKERGRGGLLKAEACLALAEGGLAEYNELENALRSEPEALSAWYVLGIAALNRKSSLDHNKVRAVKESSPMFRILLEA